MKKLLKWNVGIFTILLIILNIGSYIVIQLYEYNYQKKMAKLPAIVNDNYVEIQKEWFELETEYRPFIGWKRKPINRKFTNIDDNGDRFTVQPNAKSESVIRFFGGSTIWGASVEDAYTIPSLFGNCNDKFTIHNHGESGFNSRQDLAYFINLLLKGSQTDIAVFYDGVNDVEHLCRKMISIPGHGREVQMQEELATVNSTQSYFAGKDGIIGLSKELISKVFIKNSLELGQRFVGKYLNQTPVHPYCCHDDLNRAERVANHIINNWKIAHQIAEANGIQMIAILQPNAYTGDSKKDYLPFERSGLLEKNFKEIYKIMREQIKGYDWIYDFTEILDEEQTPIYYDFCHLNEKGNNLIAKGICVIVTDLELERYSPKGVQSSSLER